MMARVLQEYRKQSEGRDTWGGVSERRRAPGMAAEGQRALQIRGVNDYTNKPIVCGLMNPGVIEYPPG
jgi:hypothetical protein